MQAKEIMPNLLNEQQLLMLRLLKKPLPEASFVKMRQLAVKLLADQVDETIEEWELKNGITEKDYEQVPHFRSSNKNR